MFLLEDYMTRVIDGLRKRFGEHLVYVGLQGSYLRGEADEESDLDLMVVLDELSVADMEAYREVIESLEHSERSCGFLCGREELAHWNALELCHLLHTTKDYVGTLSSLIPPFEERDARQFVKLSLGNLYHELFHRYVHASAEENRAALPRSAKSVFFLLQNMYWLKTGVFAPTQKELLTMLEEGDRRVLLCAMRLRAGEICFEEDFACLFSWCRNALCAF